MGTDRDRRREWMLPAMIRIPPHHPASPPPLFPSFPSSVWECHFSGHCKGYDKKSKWMCLQDRYSDLCNLFSLLLTEHTSAHVWKRKGKKDRIQIFGTLFWGAGSEMSHFGSPGAKWRCLQVRFVHIFISGCCASPKIFKLLLKLTPL